MPDVNIVAQTPQDTVIAEYVGNGLARSDPYILVETPDDAKIPTCNRDNYPCFHHKMTDLLACFH